MIARRRRIFGLTIFAVVLLSIVSLYLFYNWDQIVSLSNDIDEQIMNTPTPLPTSIPKPTVRATPTPTPVPNVTPCTGCNQYT